MFAKLLKHEWRATKGILALLCVIILISGLTVGLSTRHLLATESGTMAMVELEENTEILEVICVLLTMFGMFAIGFCCIGAFFLLISRFYKRCFTDEGYLTFTLPVNNHQILLSSIVNTVLGMVVVALAAFLGIGMIFGLFLTAIPQEIIWADVWVSLEEVWQQILESVQKNSMEFAMTGLSAAIGAFAVLVELMLAVTIGALIAKKHKILTAVAVYYGINMVTTVVQSFFAMTATFSQNLSWLLGSTVLVSLVMAVGGYFVMHYLINKKLNLT